MTVATVWVVRNTDGSVLDYGTCEDDVAFWALKSDQPYTITQECLLTPEMMAVIEAAKVMAGVISQPTSDNYREWRAATHGLGAAVATLRRLEAQL